MNDPRIIAMDYAMRPDVGMLAKVVCFVAATSGGLGDGTQLSIGDDLIDRIRAAVAMEHPHADIKAVMVEHLGERCGISLVFDEGPDLPPYPELLSPEYGFVYLVKCGPRYKIGVTTDMARRMGQLRRQAPFPLEIVSYAQGRHYIEMESTLHFDWRAYREHGEWFEFDPGEVAAIVDVLTAWQEQGTN